MIKYFIISFIVTIVLMSILTYCIFQKPKIIHKVKKILKKTVYIILYCLLMYFAALSYSMCSLICSENSNVISPIVSSAYLLFSIWITNLYYEKQFPDNTCDESDKKRGIALAYLTVILLGLIFSVYDDSEGGWIISCSALAVLLGMYISVEDCLNNLKPKEFAKIYFRKIIGDIKYLKTSIVVIIFLLGLSCLQFWNFMRSIQCGIGAGEIAFMVVFLIYTHFSKKE